MKSPMKVRLTPHNDLMFLKEVLKTYGENSWENRGRVLEIIMKEFRVKYEGIINPNLVYRPKNREVPIEDADIHLLYMMSGKDFPINFILSDHYETVEKDKALDINASLRSEKIKLDEENKKLLEEYKAKIVENETLRKKIAEEVANKKIFMEMINNEGSKESE
jgi:hypothetical protein